MRRVGILETEGRSGYGKHPYHYEHHYRDYCRVHQYHWFNRRCPWQKKLSIEKEPIGACACAGADAGEMERVLPHLENLAGNLCWRLWHGCMYRGSRYLDKYRYRSLLQYAANRHTTRFLKPDSTDHCSHLRYHVWYYWRGQYSNRP